MHKLLFTVLVLLVIASCSFAQNVYTDNVVIVLDGSGSMTAVMGGSNITRLEAAKNAIKEMLKTIPSDTNVGLLLFSKGWHDWVYELGPRNDELFIAAVEKIQASGLTPLGEYMKKGADKLLEARQAQYGYGSYRLLVVTDGEASDKALMEAVTPEIIARGIIADVIGVDLPSDHTLATKVHSYRRANDPESLRRAIQEVFAEVDADSGDLTSDAMFAELEGFPMDLVIPAINAFARSGNHPIGEQPASPVQAQPDEAAEQTSVQQPAQPQQQKQAQPAQQTKPAADSSSSDSGNKALTALIILIIGAFVLKSVFSK